MKKNTSIALLGAVLLSVSACKNAPDSDEALTGDAQEVTLTEGSTSVNINPATSSLEWIGTKMSTYHNGTVAIKSGTLLLKGGVITGGNFVIDMPTLKSVKDDDMTNGKLTGHLQSPDFFDVAKFPEAKLEITSVKPNTTGASTGGDQPEINEYTVADPNYMISANLTIKDVTKNIEFPAKVTVNNSGVSAVAKFNIDRKQWGIVYKGMPDDLIQDLIWFGVSIKADAPVNTASL
ncbi:MAG TPA: YceI family protein [Chitinophagales bacterium]|nr:YceI family protein [Chitinophagales bacterium]